MAGNDLRIMTPEILEILTNKEAIAMANMKSGISGAKKIWEQLKKIYNLKFRRTMPYC